MVAVNENGECEACQRWGSGACYALKADPEHECINNAEWEGCQGCDKVGCHTCDPIPWGAEDDPAPPAIPHRPK